MRKKYTAKYKAEAVLEVLREAESLNEIAGRLEVHPNMLGRWKNEVVWNLFTVFENDNGDPLACLHRQDQPADFVFQPNHWVDRAYAVERVLGASAVAFVAPKTGDHVLTPAFQHQPAKVGVGNETAGHGDDVSLAINQGLLAGIQILVSADGGYKQIFNVALHMVGIVKDRGLLQGEAGGVGGGPQWAPQLHDIDIFGGFIQKGDAFVQGIASRFRQHMGFDQLDFELIHHHHHAKGAFRIILRVSHRL